MDAMEILKNDLKKIEGKYDDCTTIADSFDADHEQQRVAWLKKSDFWDRIAGYLRELIKIKEEKDV
jgi:hypothetical protein